MLDSIFGSAGAQTLGAGAASNLIQAPVMPGMNLLGQEAAMQTVDPILASIPGLAQQGQGGFVGSLQKLFGNESFGNAFNMGKDAFQMWDSQDQRRQMKNFQDQNMAMAQGTYDANMADRDRTSNLKF